nr:hypothetical protein [uncultured Shimia sp.]
MAKRTVYIPMLDQLGVVEKEVEFEWFPGFSVAQKQRSIASLHERAMEEGIEPVLEISSKSPDEAGVQASAFNLSFEMKKSGRRVSVEAAFQGSKTFAGSGPFPDMYEMSAREAKKEIRIRQNGTLTKFTFFGKEFPLKPRTFFYDWLYIKTLSLDEDLANKIEGYAAFTDIEFNPNKSINCQAYSAALFVSLQRSGFLDDALETEVSFKSVLSEVYRKREARISFQSSLI